MKFLFTLFLIFGAASTASAGIKTEEVKYSSGGVQLTGFLAYEEKLKGKRPGILVVHEWWGHNEHARNRAIKLAKLGYTAFAADMYGSGKLADHPDQAGEFMKAALSDWEAAQAKFREAKKILMAHETVNPEKIGAIGFCFGGLVSLRMARGGEDLDAVVAFHSAFPPSQPAVEKGKVTASILVVNGSDDPFIKSDDLAAFVKQMKEADADFTYMSMKGVKHSFTNPKADEFSKKFNLPAMKYDKQADKKSWRAMHRFFKGVFAK